LLLKSTPSWGRFGAMLRMIESGQKWLTSDKALGSYDVVLKDDMTFLKMLKNVVAKLNLRQS
jgi:hypothetical protein